MASIRLRKLPARTPIRLTISVSPDLHRTLGEYAAAYREAYGVEESVADLVPPMLEAFIESDRDFARVTRARRT